MKKKAKCKIVLYNKKSLLGMNITYDKLVRKNIQNKVNSTLWEKIKKSFLIIKKTNTYKDPVNNFPRQVEFSIIKNDCLNKINIKIEISKNSNNYINKKGLKYSLITKCISVYCDIRTIVNSLQIDISGFNINHQVRMNDLFLFKGMSTVSKLNIIILKVKKKK